MFRSMDQFWAHDLYLTLFEGAHLKNYFTQVKKIEKGKLHVKELFF